MSSIATAVISYPVNSNARWSDAHNELFTMEEQRVTVSSTTTGPDPKEIGRQEGATLATDLKGAGADAVLTVWAMGVTYVIERREVRGAEVAPGYVSFVFNDYRPSFPSLTFEQGSEQRRARAGAASCACFRSLR